MNKIVSTKRTSAIFLAIVLVAGTFAAISPLFIVKGVNAQGDPYYGGMDSIYDDRKSYGMDDSYGYSDYRDDKDKKSYDDSYGYSDYGMDSIYDDRKSYDDSYGYSDYGMDSIYDDRKSYDKRSYRNDYGYESQYQPSYKPDYKPVKDDKRDQSSKDSKSVNINKLKCINDNININGNNTADINVGNKGSAGGYLGAYSSGGSGYEDEGYYDRYNNNNKQDKGFDCVTNNNDNIVQGRQGQVGPQGPSGITQLINGTNVYLVTNSATAPGGQSLEVTALCEPGDFVLNGGYTYSGSLAGPNMFVAFNEPLTNPSGGGWRTGVFATGGGIENSLTVHAYCFDNSP